MVTSNREPVREPISDPIREPIGKLISHLHRQNQKILAKELLPYGIGSGGQHSFLKLVLSHPGITQDQMTSRIKCDKATTTRSVKLLEASGYIERRTDPKDRRSFLLYPTPRRLNSLRSSRRCSMISTVSCPWTLPRVSWIR